MKKTLLLIIILILFVSCNSVKKYNEHITKLHTIENLYYDIDKLYEQLIKNHPKLYQYTSKEVLDFKFDSLKKSINQPITSREFYKKLAPVLAHVKQGHLTVGSVRKKYTKKELKDLPPKKLEFFNLDLEYLDNSLFVKRTFGKDSSLVGNEIISIDGEEVHELIETYKTRFASDGYNTTLHNRLVGRHFTKFYIYDKGFVDSLKVTFKNKDSIFSKQFGRIKKKDIKTKIDSVKVPKEKPMKISKLEKKEHKLKKKQKKKIDKKYGFIGRSKEYTRNFDFIGKDSVIAYMKIRSFSNGNYKKFYKESFAKLDSAKTKHFILDLRDNGGGRIAEIDYLYAYLTNKDYIFIEPSEVTSKLHITKSLLSNGNRTLLKIIGMLRFIEPISLAIEYSKTKKIDGKLYFKMKYNKLKKPNKMHYDGKMYVLINGNSFSASSLISTHLKANKRAIFVGEETGGAFNGCIAGFYKIYKLPNTKLKTRIGLMQIETPQVQTPDGYGVKPDITILPNIEDRKSNIDTELQWILKDIHKQD